MYNLLVVEDEKYTRDRVVKYLSEELSLYFNIYSADDGKTALELMEKIQIDIVVTDIMMQYINGIELAEQIHKNYSKCIVMIMSGYDEFEYAQKAIQFKVRKYFLKPFDLSELCSEIMSYKSELDKENKNTFENVGKMSAERERFFENFIYNDIKDPEVELDNAKKLFFPFDLDNTPCDIILLKIDEYESFLADKWYYGVDTLKLALSNLIKGFLNNNYIFCIRSEKGYFEFLVYHSEKEMDYLDLTKKISVIVNISILLCKEPERFSSIREIRNREKEIDNIDEPAFKFISYIKNKNYDEAKKTLLTASKNEIIWDNFKDFLSKFGLKLENTDDFQQDSLYEKYAEILENNNEAEHINDNIAVSIERAKKYIQENYEKNILREDAAKIALFSSSYFTKNFKVYTGESFSDYLLKVRMTNAARLIKEGEYNISQIAKMVGYQTPKYFYRVFKMYYGCTPKEYAVNEMLKAEASENKEGV